MLLHLRLGADDDHGALALRGHPCLHLGGRVQALACLGCASIATTGVSHVGMNDASALCI